MTEVADHHAAKHLSAAETRLYRAVSQSRPVGILCVVILAAAGWVYIGLMVGALVQTGHSGSLGPGMGLFDLLAPIQTGPFGRMLFATLCGPLSGASVTTGWSAVGYFLAFAMWAAMTLAMMLPSAGAMIMTYTEIADTAAAKRERVVSPLVLTAGYVVVWLVFALAASLVQAGMTRIGLVEGLGPAGMLFSGAVFIGAGVFQFSALKHACLTACQRPFPFFFANWTQEPGGVFGLGFRQGLYCVGCCWAMMALMFAIGVMNLVWMAALGIIMTIEKMGAPKRFSYGVGILCIGIGVAFIVASLVEHWPARA